MFAHVTCDKDSRISHVRCDKDGGRSGTSGRRSGSGGWRQRREQQQ